MDHELFWKEAIVFTLVAMFSFGFYSDAGNSELFIGFILLSAAFYFITMWEEKNSDKSFHDYFHYTSSYFALAGFFFLASYVLLALYSNSFLLLTASVGIILFSVGFMNLLFARLDA